MAPQERRRFLRHLLINPLEFKVLGGKKLEKTRTVDVGEGGLMFMSKKNVAIGMFIRIQMPIYDKVFKVKAEVVHSQKDKNTGMYNIGVSFVSYSDAFKVKLIEQIYLIEEYRGLRSLQLGKELTIQEASIEWIKRYSERFKKLYW